MRKLKVYETTHAPNQFTSVAKLPATPLTFIGNICTSSNISIRSMKRTVNEDDMVGFHNTSDITTQGTAPIPAEKDAIYNCDQRKVSRNSRGSFGISKWEHLYRKFDVFVH